MPELGCYGLAGHTADPADLLDEVRTAEELGLGAVFLSERFNVKDAGVLAGAAAAVSSRIGIGTAATNHNTRHPLVTATMATTLHRLSGGRYAFGLGRGFDLLFDVMGLPRVTGAQLEDAIAIYRTLWSGGSVVGHEGPAGSFPYLSQDSSFDERIPVLMTAIGDRTLELAGRVADGVVLHTFLTDEALARSVATVRRAADEAGRDPGSVRVWAVLARSRSPWTRRWPCARRSAASRRTSRATGRCSSTPTAGRATTSTRFRAGPPRRRLPGSLRRRRDHRAAHLPARRGDPGALARGLGHRHRRGVRGADRRPARRRGRQRHPARRDARPSSRRWCRRGAGSGTPTGSPTCPPTPAGCADERRAW